MILVSWDAALKNILESSGGPYYNLPMFAYFNLPAKILRLLEANISSREVAAGVCLGMFMGFVPLNGPMAFLLTIFFLFFKLNRLSTLITLPLFKLLYFLGVYRITDAAGGLLLIDAGFLTPFWNVVTGLPVIAYFDLNNTLVTGGLFFSGCLCAPVYFASERGITVLRARYGEKMKDAPFMKIIKKVIPMHKIAALLEKIRGKA